MAVDEHSDEEVSDTHSYYSLEGSDSEIEISNILIFFIGSLYFSFILTSDSYEKAKKSLKKVIAGLPIDECFLTTDEDDNIRRIKWQTDRFMEHEEDGKILFEK